MYDSLNAYVSSLTPVTSLTSYTSSAVTHIGGTPRRGLKARVVVQAYSAATAGTVLTPYLQVSPDNTNWSTLVNGVALTATTSAVGSEQSLNFEAGPSQAEYSRVLMTLNSTANTPTFTFYAELGDARP